jgi:hypothetical protein
MNRYPNISDHGLIGDLQTAALVGTRDGKTVVLRAGESVWTPAGEEHFHGGTVENMMCHYAILDASGGEATTWLEPVTDKQYLAAQRRAGV